MLDARWQFGYRGRDEGDRVEVAFVHGIDRTNAVTYTIV
jgi:hypothetical protein